MIRTILFLAAVLAAAVGLSWLSDNPGTVSIYWPALNLKADPSVFQVIIGLALLVGTALVGWSIFRQLWNSPAAVGMMMNRRRQKRGLDALSTGMIAIGAGDRDTATRYAIQARKSLPNEPLTHLLRAQAAQLSGDKATSRRIFEAMLSSPDTEQLGLRGLFGEAQREKEPEAARQFAARALKLNPKLAWASDALFDIQCKSGDWDGALETLAVARRNNHIEKSLADRRRAVLLTGLAQQVQETDPAKALQRAIEAHGLAPDLVPAANLAGRMLSARGNTGKAASILQKTWQRSPHPDLAVAYAFARVGDSPRDRLDRVKQLAALNPHSPESPIAIAQSAIEAKAFDEARSALELMLDGRLTQRVATLMARIESDQHGDKGRVREWLARAVLAPRDPVWTADGVVADTWAPVSPVTGQLDAFQWRVPVETAGSADAEQLTRKVEELVALGATTSAVLPVAEEASLSKAVAAKPSEPQSPAQHRSATVVDVDVVPARPAPLQAAKPTAEAEPIVAAAKPTADFVGVAPVVPVSAKATAAVEPAKPATVSPAKPTPQKAAAVTTPPKSVSAVAQAGAAPEAAAPGSPVTASGGQPPKPAAKKPVDTTGKEPRIFVVPHAPDDPGPDASEPDAAGKGVRPPYRAVP